MSLTEPTAPIEPPPTTGRRTPRRWLRRLALVVALTAAALLVVSLVAGRLARQRFEAAVGEALQAKVSIGELSWALYPQSVTARNVHLQRAGEMEIEEVSVQVEPSSLVRGSLVVLPQVRIRGVRGAVEVVDGVPILPALGGGGGSTAPDVSIGQLLIEDADIALEGKGPKGRLWAEGLHVDRVDLQQIAVSHGGQTIVLHGDFKAKFGDSALAGKLDVAFEEGSKRVDMQLDGGAIAIRSEMLGRPAGITLAAESVGAGVEYRAKAKGGEEATLQLEVKRPAITAAGQNFAARSATVGPIRVDLARKQIDLGDIVLTAPSTELDVEAWQSTATAESKETDSPGWKVVARQVTAKGGEVALRLGEQRLRLELATASWRQSDGKLALRGSTTKGKVEVDGRVELEPLRLDVGAEASGIALSELTPFLPATPLRLARGEGDAKLHITYEDGVSKVEGTVNVRDLATLPPEPTRPEEVMALHAASAEIVVHLDKQLKVMVPTLRLEYPYVMVARRADGTFPFTAFAGKAPPGGEGETTATAPAPAHPTTIEIDRLDLVGARIEAMDYTVEPNYWMELGQMYGFARGVVLPAGEIEEIEVAGLYDEVSNFKLHGTRVGSKMQGKASVENLFLDSLNPYIAQALGYEIRSGLASWQGTLRPTSTAFELGNRVVVNGVRVSQTGFDAIQQQTGVPLPVVLGLLKNVSGEISLDVPVQIDVAGRKASLGSFIGDAVRRAIAGAVSYPLRILGSLFGKEGPPHSFPIDPVVFAAADTDLDAAAKERVAQIARIVGAHHELLVVLMPQVTNADMASSQRRDPQRLAAARAEAVRSALQEEAALPTERIVIVPWDPAVGSKATGQPSVYVELQSSS